MPYFFCVCPFKCFSFCCFFIPKNRSKYIELDKKPVFLGFSEFFILISNIIQSAFIVTRPISMKEELIKATKSFVKKLFKIKSKEYNYVYHNWQHSKNVCEEAIKIAEHAGLDHLTIENIALAALFHDVGYEIDSGEHEKRGAEIAEEFLMARGFEQERIESIKDLIMATKVFTDPQNLEEMIMKDADLAHLGKPYFFKNYYNLQKELNTVFQMNIDDDEWCRSTIDFINKQKYYTDYAKENYHPVKLENLKQLIKMKEVNFGRKKAV